MVIEDTVRIFYPGPLLDERGAVVEPGEVWLVERPVSTMHAITPMTQWGIWDCAEITLDLYNWAGNYSALPDGKHSNVFTFAGMNELISFMQKDLVLRYKWLPKLKLNEASKQGLAWLKDEEQRRVGPVEWDRVRVNEHVTALEPTIVTPQ